VSRRRIRANDEQQHKTGLFARLSRQSFNQRGSGTDTGDRNRAKQPLPRRFVVTLNQHPAGRMGRNKKDENRSWRFFRMFRSLYAGLVVIAGSMTGCIVPNREGSAIMSANEHSKTRMLAEFEGDSPRFDDLSGEWRIVNDNIMGGRSLGGGKIQNGVMVFRGSTNTNGGGFASIRASDKQWDLTGFDGLGARVRADGRRYVFHVFTGLSYDNGNVFYRGEFKTKPLINTEGDPLETPEAWQEVFVAFSDFVPMVRGRAITGRVEPLDPAKIEGIGLMIDDGLDGPFRLEADWIHAQVLPASG